MSVSRASRYPARSNTVRAAATREALVRTPRAVTGRSRKSSVAAMDGGGRSSQFSEGSAFEVTCYLYGKRDDLPSSTSGERDPAVDGNGLAGDVSACRGGQPHHGCREFFRISHSTHDQAGSHRFEVAVVVLVGHFRLEESRRD